jgi:hypothetical protein
MEKIRLDKFLSDAGFCSKKRTGEFLERNKGITMKRMMPAAMGSGHRINKRTSHLNLLLSEKVAKVLDVKKTKAVKATKTVKAKKVTKK